MNQILIKNIPLSQQHFCSMLRNGGGIFMKKLLLVLVYLCVPFFLWASYFSFLPYTIKQPSGEKFECFVSGDEYYNWLHDQDGYTIIQDSDGYFYYAIEKDGKLTASTYRVGVVAPSTTKISKWLKIKPEVYYTTRAKLAASPPPLGSASHVGTINNLVIFIRFADDGEFTTTRQTFNTTFNASTGKSLKTYYNEVSYNQLDISTTFYPACVPTSNLSYQDANPRGYYEPYNATTNTIGYDGGDNGDERTLREHTLLKNAIEWVNANSSIPSGLNIDSDNNGQVDNVCFIIKGGNGAWNSLLWAHKWSLYSFNVPINGKKVWDYTFQPETQVGVSTLCHEMFHVLGAPDLYHYTSSAVTPVGQWDLMGSGSAHMGAYMKWKYAGAKWVTSLPEITTTGTYTLNPLTSATNNCYKIRSPFSESEFFVVEYRKKNTQYENALPDSGLLVYRIDTRNWGNSNGPPDEVYVYRPDGTTTVNGSLSSACFSQTNSRTAINDGTNPSSFLQDGSQGGLSISNVSTAGQTISFDVLISSVYNPSSFYANIIKSNSITLSWQKNSSNNNILLAWSPNGQFGTPVNGTTYQAGNTLPGGGTVLTVGDASNFLHSGLEPGETYTYKIWSFNAGNTYSSGINTSATTSCPVISTFPYVQSFSGNKQPGCWENHSNTSQNQIWQFGTLQGFATLPALGDSYAYLNSLQYGAGQIQDADLISLSFDFSQATNIEISFNHYLNKLAVCYGTFSYSIDNGQTWVEKAKFQTKSATNPANYTIDLTTELEGKNYVQFRWKYVGSNDYYWAIDDFTVNAESTISDTLTVTSGEFGEGDNVCLNAYQTIIVGGGRSTVEFFPYANATFIAGQSVQFLPGFYAHEGSQITAYITTENEFCNMGDGDKPGTSPEKSEYILQEESNPAPNDRSIHIYPNPARGTVMLAVGDERINSLVTIYNSVGSKVLPAIIARENITTIDLSTLKSGLYIVAITNGKMLSTRKLIIK